MGFEQEASALEVSFSTAAPKAKKRVDWKKRIYISDYLFCNLTVKATFFFKICLYFIMLINIPTDYVLIPHSTG